MDKSNENKPTAVSGNSSGEPDYYLENGKVVFTASFHLKRGYCCRSGCRHCPFNHKPESEKEKASLERDALG